MKELIAFFIIYKFVIMKNETNIKEKIRQGFPMADPESKVG